MIDRPVPAKILLRLFDAKSGGEKFMSLSTALYQENLIYKEPRELRRNGKELELIVIFCDKNSFKTWKTNESIKNRWAPKFKNYLTAAPRTIEQKDVMIELDTPIICTCSKTKYFLLQGRELGLSFNELNCSFCLGQIPYSRIPTGIKIENWQRQYGRIYLNYFESSFLEKRSLKELTNYKGVLYKEGQNIRSQLSTYFKKPVYLVYFNPNESKDTLCPVCGTKGIKSGLGRPLKICKKCHTAFGMREMKLHNE